MASGVYYNQEVTAEMLNGMAADLGHTSFNGFGDEKFGANELNKITGDLVSAGVLISGNMCRVVKDDSGNIILQTGIIVFGNGAKMDITSPITIDADAGTVIYALNDTLQGKCSIEVAESYPAEGDFVKLCSVKTDGTLTDTRTVSKAKMELYTGNSSWSVNNSHTYAYYDKMYVYTNIPKVIWETYNYFCYSIVSAPSKYSNGNYSGFQEISKIEFNTEFSAIHNENHSSLKMYIYEEDSNIVVRSLLYHDDANSESESGTTKFILV